MGAGKQRKRQGQRETEWNAETDKGRQRREFSRQMKENENKFGGRGKMEGCSRSELWEQMSEQKGRGAKAKKRNVQKRKWGLDEVGAILYPPGPLTDGCCVTFISQYITQSLFLIKLFYLSSVKCSGAAVAPGIIY